MMRIIVSDSNCLINLRKALLLDAFLGLIHLQCRQVEIRICDYPT
jgi:hypothetical protein